MNIFPAIDLIDGCAVRLTKGDYAQTTVDSAAPADVALRDMGLYGAIIGKAYYEGAIDLAAAIREAKH